MLSFHHFAIHIITEPLLSQLGNLGNAKIFVQNLSFHLPQFYSHPLSLLVYIYIQS